MKLTNLESVIYKFLFWLCASIGAHLYLFSITIYDKLNSFTSDIVYYKYATFCFIILSIGLVYYWSLLKLRFEGLIMYSTIFFFMNLVLTAFFPNNLEVYTQFRDGGVRMDENGIEHDYRHRETSVLVSSNCSSILS